MHLQSHNPDEMSYAMQCDATVILFVVVRFAEALGHARVLVTSETSSACMH